MAYLASNEYAQLLAERDAYKFQVELMESLERLDKHSDFQKVFRQYLLTDVLRKTSVDWAKTDNLEYAHAMRALLQLDLMLNTIKENGTIARQQLDSIEAFENNLTIED